MRWVIASAYLSMVLIWLGVLTTLAADKINSHRRRSGIDDPFATPFGDAPRVPVHHIGETDV